LAQIKNIYTYDLHRSIKFTNTVFFVPSRRTWGGLITVLRRSPARSGLCSRRMLNTLPRSCTKNRLESTRKKRREDWKQFLSKNWKGQIENALGNILNTARDPREVNRLDSTRIKCRILYNQIFSKAHVDH